jgi:arylsulfatase A-like enzyme
MSASNERALPPGTLTMASMLKSLEYTTGMAGKWHLGSKPEWGPNRYGFDSSYGSLAGAVGMYDHRYRLNSPFAVTWHRDGEIIPGYENGTHTTDLTAHETVRWIESHADDRWFFYVPFHAVHTPIDERDEKWHAMNHHIESDDRRAFAAAVSHMDWAIGKFIEAFEKTGQLDETLVLFTSDNGAQVNHAGNAYPAPDPALKNFSSNAPLRGRKAQLYEGGYRVPASIYWPAELQSRKVEAPLHVVDWMPTFAALLEYDAREEPQWDGENIWPLLSGERETLGERTFYLTWHGDRRWESLRHGDWKIARRAGRPWELFNLREDPYEKQDVADRHPERVAELVRKFDEERAKDGQ